MAVDIDVASALQTLILRAGTKGAVSHRKDAGKQNQQLAWAAPKRFLNVLHDLRHDGGREGTKKIQYQGLLRQFALCGICCDDFNLGALLAAAAISSQILSCGLRQRGRELYPDDPAKRKLRSYQQDSTFAAPKIYKRELFRRDRQRSQAGPDDLRMVRLVFKTGGLVLVLKVQRNQRYVATGIHTVDEVPNFATSMADGFEQGLQQGIRRNQGPQTPTGAAGHPYFRLLPLGRVSSPSTGAWSDCTLAI
jgi:hypothetical protein